MSAVKTEAGQTAAFVNRHCGVEHLSVETSVRAARINSGVTLLTLSVTRMQLRDSDRLLSSLHSGPLHSASLPSHGCLLYGVCQL